MRLLLVCLLICLSSSHVFGRVPPRNSQTESEGPAVDAAKPEEASSATDSNPIERTPVSETDSNDESSAVDKPRKPIGVILFRTQPQISIFRDRSPFGPSFGSEMQPFPGMHSPHFSMRNGFGHDDPALRLLCKFHCLCFSTNFFDFKLSVINDDSSFVILVIILIVPLSYSLQPSSSAIVV